MVLNRKRVALSLKNRVDSYLVLITHLERVRSPSWNKKATPIPLQVVVPFLVIVLLLGGAFGIDSLVNGNKIYQGISIGEIDVSGLTQQEAVEQVSGYYSPRVSGNVATFYSSEEAQANPQTPENAGNVERADFIRRVA